MQVSQSYGGQLLFYFWAFNSREMIREREDGKLHEPGTLHFMVCALNLAATRGPQGNRFEQVFPDRSDLIVVKH